MTIQRPPSTLEPIFPVWAIWQWKWTVLTVTLGVTAVSVGLGMARTIRYEAVALVIPEIRHVSGHKGDDRVLESYMEVTRQALMMHAVLLKSDAALTAIADSTRARDREALRDRLRAEIAREPMTLQISAWDEEPQRAAMVANAAANYAISHAGATNRLNDVDAQAHIEKLWMEFDTRLTAEAHALAQASIQGNLARTRQRMSALHYELARLEHQRRLAESGPDPVAVSSLEKALSAKRDELSRLEQEQAVVNETLHQLRRSTQLAASAFESANSEYLQSALSVAVRMADLRLLKAAEVPQHPMPRHLNIIAAIGALCGLMISALGVLYVEYAARAT